MKVHEATNHLTSDQRLIWSQGYEFAANLFFDHERTLRDEFAIAAMKAYIDHVSREGDILSKRYKEVAEEAYTIADAMLEARKTSVPQGNKAHRVFEGPLG